MSVMGTAVVVATMVIMVGYEHMFVRCCVQMEMVSGCFIDRFRGGTNHRDGRKRLNRKAQCKQHDEEEFAPVGHGCRV